MMNLGYRQRQLALCEAILKHRPFRETFRLYLETGIMPDASAIVSVMKQSGLYKVESISTYKRRSSTVSGWIHWMLSLAEG